MKLRTLGSLRVSEVGLGCNNFGSRLDQDATTSVVLAALDAGINFFDTADIYGDLKSEVQLGVALGSRRDEAIIASKFGMLHDKSGVLRDTGVRANVVRRVTAATRYRCHRPLPTALPRRQHPTRGDPRRDAGVGRPGQGPRDRLFEPLRGPATRGGRRRGRRTALRLDSEPVFAPRARTRDRRRPRGLRRTGPRFLPFYPLANGLLTGKVRPGAPVPEGTRLSLMPDDRKAHWLGERLRSRVDALFAYSEETEVAMLDFAFSWLLSHPAGRLSDCGRVHGGADSRQRRGRARTHTGSISTAQ